jgi:amino acid adenylation domain-containing protein
MTAVRLSEYSCVDYCREEIETSLPRRFERQVEKYPLHSAIKTEMQNLSYTELNQMSNRIARLICSKGSSIVETVGLLFDPGVDMIIAILGVLKAGKIWVSLDPSHPFDRISYILKDSTANLILTNTKNIALATKLIQKENVLINTDEINCNLGDDNLNIPISSDSYAHIIYTSGSSGQPKGVLHNHRLQLHNIWLHTNAFGICPDDRISLFSSLGFLSGITDMLRALLNGATLLPYNLRNEGFLNLSAWLRREGITIYHSVPSVFRQLMGALTEEEKFFQIRIIHLGGEAVVKKDVELYKKHFSSECVLVNNLGSSEAPTLRQYFIRHDTKIKNDIVPVGFPVEDKNIFIINDDGSEIGTGQVGEIAVRSPFLASGYWQKPELTQKAFLPDPTGRDLKIFKTGDLGRMLPDACLLYLGRKDNQVKIGGQRIEIAEIENVLFEHSQLKTCVVVLHGNINEERYLVAYLEPKNQQRPSVTELQNYLKQKLPNYMIPSKFVFLKSMPLLPNGKIDRLALPAPDRLRPELTTDYVAPQSDLERSIADIWQELLRIDQIGINDDFFELGGHSLLATQLLSRINQIFKITLPLKRIFEASTVKTIAILIDMVISTATSQKRIINSASEERETIVI